MERTGVQYFEGLAPAKRLPLRDLYAFVVKGMHQFVESRSVKLCLVTAQGCYFLLPSSRNVDDGVWFTGEIKGNPVNLM
jgi:hypothetical protein